MARFFSKFTGTTAARAASCAVAALAITGGAIAVAKQPGVELPARAQPDRVQLAQAPAAPAAAPNLFNDAQKAAIGAIVKEYFIKNPEAFLEIQNAVEANMEKLQAEKLKTALKDNAKDIFKRANAPIAGNPNGDITVVEFFDYNCGYCKKAYGDLAKLVEKDSKVRVVLKELPILSKGSEEASKVALAAKMQGKYWEAHRALLGVRGELNEQTSLKAVEKIGVDLAKLKKDMDSAEVKGEILFVRELAQKMGIQGTPHFLVGDKVIPGAPGNLLETMTGHIAELRKSGCSVC